MVLWSRSDYFIAGIMAILSKMFFSTIFLMRICGSHDVVCTKADSCVWLSEVFFLKMSFDFFSIQLQLDKNSYIREYETS